MSIWLLLAIVYSTRQLHSSGSLWQHQQCNPRCGKGWGGTGGRCRTCQNKWVCPLNKDIASRSNSIHVWNVEKITRSWLKYTVHGLANPSLTFSPSLRKKGLIRPYNQPKIISRRPVCWGAGWLVNNFWSWLVAMALPAANQKRFARTPQRCQD